jgi:peptidyl-prolyl cis-trans isomerase A (cyclophilin A)
MNKALLIGAALLLLGFAPASAQPGSTQAQAQSPARQGLVRVALTTSLGRIVLALDSERAPATTANFLRYVDGKRLDGINFYRAMKIGAGGLVQGGLENDPKRLLPPVEHEPTSRTGIRHGDGTISMARYAPGTARGEFFITIGEQKFLDADPAMAGDNLGFAAFGHVVEGMDVIRRILEAPASPAKGEGAMKGQMLAEPVRILSARRVE